MSNERMDAETNTPFLMMFGEKPAREGMSEVDMRKRFRDPGLGGMVQPPPFVDACKCERILRRS
ncbi:MAG: hypothetical protein QNK37_22200 [Acidobacteriota bacterium]|nr:hypothetical protein [Acidobacteriota bacterium]